jgi:hypothetical protein
MQLIGVLFVTSAVVEYVQDIPVEKLITLQEDIMPFCKLIPVPVEDLNFSTDVFLIVEPCAHKIPWVAKRIEQLLIFSNVLYPVPVKLIAVDNTL